MGPDSAERILSKKIFPIEVYGRVSWTEGLRFTVRPHCNSQQNRWVVDVEKDINPLRVEVNIFVLYYLGKKRSEVMLLPCLRLAERTVKLEF